MLFSNDREKIYCEEKPLGLFSAVETNDSRSWIAFDLDDTLHEFRRASGAATTGTLEAISEKYGTPLSALKEQYSNILKEKTANAFSDGKTSHDYRRERFAAVLAHFSHPLDPIFLSCLLTIYESTLITSLELKCGAASLLSTLKRLGKMIAVVTEGPQDAQERTIQALGIAAQIDFLATTNRFGVSKTQGLFPKVLQFLGVPAADVAYVGDSEERDMQPAMAEGIFCVHLAEAKHIALDEFPPRVNTLRELEYIISDGAE
ncbi:HAD-superfamily hydrolase, subfamily IA, variant 1 [Mycena pura]|uniref:HAD-superfamily hydrolase, subfamily IA, variant 1 n=1 Tax=Mycena pura TaxID=153505 RepID=A0AAD6VMF9_9AGAR|nr:HAD-superfamily hydrolase, subfamily IA, variant 1 [Mycena pura]